jgi:hypothetical protein
VTGRWPRPFHEPSGLTASVRLYAFGTIPLGPAPLALGEHGAPDAAAVALLGIAEHSRADDPAWFDAFRSGALGAVARLSLGDAVAALDAADRCVEITAAIDDPPDLAHLQAAWAAASACVERGASCVLDLQQARWFAAAEVRPPGASFELGREVTLVPGAALHTRGLAKVARPDVVVPRVDEASHEAVAFLLNRIATGFVAGHVVAAGTGVARPGGGRYVVEAYVPGENAPDVGLANVGIVLRAEEVR